MSEERFVGHKLNQSPLSRAEADLLAHEPERHDRKKAHDLPDPRSDGTATAWPVLR